jgi:hypothetical protein
MSNSEFLNQIRVIPRMSEFSLDIKKAKNKQLCWQNKNHH